MEAVCKFFYSIWLLLLSWNIFCGDSFDDRADKIFLRTCITCCDSVTWSFFEEATSFLQHFISSSKFCLGFCMFSSSAFDVVEVVDLDLLWSHLFCLLNRSFWAIDVWLLVSAILYLLSFIWMLVWLLL